LLDENRVRSSSPRAPKSTADEKKRSSDRKGAHNASERFSTKIRARIALV
jgi:hypothetical protein